MGGPGFKHPLTVEQLEKYIKGSNNNDSNIYIYKVYDCQSNRVVGHISLGNIDRVNKSGRIVSILLDKDKKTYLWHSLSKDITL